MNSKEIDPKWLAETSGYKTSYSTKFVEWLEDHSPFFRRTLFWWGMQDYLHPSRIYRKCCNVVRWLPVLWNDTDWDYNGLYVILRTKIKNMREHHQKHHNHTDWEEVVKQMQIAEDCIDRLSKDDYLSAEWDAYHLVYAREFRWIDAPNGMKQLPPMSDEQHAVFINLVTEEEKLRQVDLETFASTFSKYVRGWWD